MITSTDVSPTAQQQFDSMVRSGIFRACERFVPYGPDREDQVAEGLAMTWQWFQREVARGRRPDVALVRHVARRRMVDRGHRLLGHEHRPRHDVFDRQGRDVELRRLEMFRDGDVERGEDPGLGLARLGIQDPTEHIVSGLDLGNWLDNLDATDQEALLLRQAGFGLVAIGKATRRSASGVFGRLHRLGEDLARRAGLELPVGADNTRLPAALPATGPSPKRTRR